MSKIKAITTLTSLRINPSDNNQAINGFYLPQLTVAQRNAIPSPSILRGGALIFTTDAVAPAPNPIGITQLYQRNGWGTIFTTTTTATGEGLANGSSPFGLPTGELATVEAGPNNAVPGFVYYNSTPNDLKPFRARNATAWTTLFASLTTATGEGLVAGSSVLSIPIGTPNPVETGGNNDQRAFIYYDSDNDRWRGRTNAGWVTFTVA
jgi:hypothetical protein